MRLASVYRLKRDVNIEEESMSLTANIFKIKAPHMQYDNHTDESDYKWFYFLKSYQFQYYNHSCFFKGSNPKSPIVDRVNYHPL